MRRYNNVPAALFDHDRHTCQHGRGGWRINRMKRPRSLAVHFSHDQIGDAQSI